MKNLFVILMSVSILSCGKDPYPKFDIKLPSGFETEVYKDGYNLLTASKYVNGDIESMIEIRYSDDWSFSTFSNNTYIAEMLKTDKFEEASSMMFNNFKVQIKKKCTSKIQAIVSNLFIVGIIMPIMLELQTLSFNLLKETNYILYWEVHSPKTFLIITNNF